MPYVVKEDIIAYVEETINILQGGSGTYNILLYRDLIGNDLNASKASNISVAVLNSNGEKVLMYNNPVIPGVSDVLSIGSASNGDPGRISFEINAAQSRILSPGDLNISITIIYADFFPNSKTYNLPNFKIGQAIEVVDPTDPIDPTEPVNPTNPGLFLGSPQFMIEHIDLDMPSTYGNMSVDSSNPNQVSKIIFRNLDKNRVRLTQLENFLINRISNDKINGIITIYNMDDPSFYCIYRIQGWSPVDITSGGGDSDNNDGIEILVVIESISNGPGVLKNEFNIGDNITYTIDTYGTANTNISSQNGILTFIDKSIKVNQSTNGNFSPTGVFITYSPFYDSYAMVEVNGISVEVGEDRTSSAVYFSPNNGITAVKIDEIRAGDQLIWNGDVAGFELEIGDEINLIYEADVDDLR
jgi:hypothetical protein